MLFKASVFDSVHDPPDDCDCAAIRAGFPHCLVTCDRDGTVTWEIIWDSGGPNCLYEGYITLNPDGSIEIIVNSGGIHVVTYNATGDYDTILATGIVVTKDTEGPASNKCTNWPTTASLLPSDSCDLDFISSSLSLF
jgi:hypothetical protein